MKREPKTLLKKAIDSLVLAIEMFNRPHELGRATATLIFLDHSFEMLMKASILHNGGDVWDSHINQTIGFDACVRCGLSNAKVRFLSDEQALTVRAINGLRDACQHYIADISEGQLYLHCMSGLTVFRDVLDSVFHQDLATKLPPRVLPLSVVPPVDLITLFENEVEAIKNLLTPGKRRLAAARARLRPLEIVESTIQGRATAIGEKDLERKCRDIADGKQAPLLFPHVAGLSLTAVGEGPTLQLRFTKKEGIPIQVVPAGTVGAFPIAMKRVNELDFYNLGLGELAEKVGLTMPKTLAVVRHLGLQGSDDFHKMIRIGGTKFQRYSQKAVHEIMERLPTLDMDVVWEECRPRKKQIIEQPKEE